MAWHLGYPLSQTLLTNVYVDSILMPVPTNIAQADFIRNRNPKEAISPMHTVLRAYCLGLVKACWYVVERIKFEHYYEVCGRDLLRPSSAVNTYVVGGGLRHKYLPSIIVGNNE